MVFLQKEIVLPPKSRGFHLITNDILKNIPEIKGIKTGLAHIFIHHTSASLTINENADPDVRRDLEAHFSLMVPDGAKHFRHTIEGPDDMSAHIKSSVLGNSLSIPITEGSFNLGTWQGIYLCEHRAHAGRRKVIVTLMGS